MICLDFDWQIDEFMVYCRSSQLREKSMKSYEQTLRLFKRWCKEEMSRVFQTPLNFGKGCDSIFLRHNHIFCRN